MNLHAQVVNHVDSYPWVGRCCRKQLFQYIQPDYYGWRDEEDGMLLLAEQMFEEQSVT